ncbi:MAG: hypothetical protein IPH46_07780 [Bacteroidetes bacterium]|nr:hypothetical protein [Bacteroidota bacterium]
MLLLTMLLVYNRLASTCTEAHSLIDESACKLGNTIILLRNRWQTHGIFFIKGGRDPSHKIDYKHLPYAEIPNSPIVCMTYSNFGGE